MHRSCTQKGLTQEDAIEAVISGLNKFLADQKKQKTLPELHAGLILCLMRFADNQKQNMETVKLAKKFLGKGVVGLDLAGAEGPIPNIKYKSFFDKAKSLTFPIQSMLVKQTVPILFAKPWPWVPKELVTAFVALRTQS